MNGNDNVGDTLREMWETRPARPREGRKLTGVSAAIGRRYGIDPVLVRVAFVVATVPGGGGLALYLALWGVLPNAEPSDDRHRLRLLVGLTLLVTIGIPTALAMLYPHGWLVFGAAIGGLYLLHRNHRAPAAVATAPPAAAPVGENTWVYPSSTARTEPPSWDPLGAAPFAWDLPEPPNEESGPPQEKRAWIGWLTVGAAVLASAVALTFSGVTAAFAVALGVLGVGMVAGAFLRGSRMLIAFALPIGALAMLLNVTEEDHGSSERQWGTPRTQEIVANTSTALQETYPYIPNGTFTLDLRQLRLTGEERVETSASVGNGRVTVLLPPGLDATATCSTDRGTVDCLGNRQSGGDHSWMEINDDGVDGPGGGHLALDLSADNGSVEVRRG
ncbi:PspC domain-containing protein [Saccharopolyspora gloriosae]|uniref:PspC domain-containing protein n=1 Tax=Saccharopolyspora gloriosae TaxID=455344 RepID=UPI001FB7B472|nr:PspC domain-containing protein [Saccharopolyspora gloriosae]